MEKNVSKKALKSLLNDSMRDAIGRLELPKSSRKVDKLLDKSSKKLAAAFASILKKETRRARKEEKALTYVDDVLRGKKTKRKEKTQVIEAV
jgi:hypothetical protein